MIIHLPAPANHQSQAHDIGRTSYILHERAGQFYGAGVGALSIKSFFGGRALYTVGRGRFALDDGAYLVLNHGQPYEVEIASEQPVESFCVFFAHGFAEQVYRDLTTAGAHLLADPAQPTAPLRFFERTYPHDAIVSPALFELRQTVAAHASDPAWLAERMHDLMLRLLQSHHDVRREVAAVPAARPATRDELYRRLHIARDYAAASFHLPVTLDDMAGAASLSPNHLLRSFRRLFGQTPHQYLVERRLEHARLLLARTDLPVTEICLAVGFSSLGAFSWLFRQRVGVPPAEYRRQNR
jgi:AraC family transcriptional regulator